MLTPRQKQIKDFINKIISKNGVAPTEREIACRFKISPSTVHEHLIALQNKGYFKKAHGRARAIEPTKPKTYQGLIKIPLLGTITAGEPVETCEIPEEITISKNLITKNGEHFALEVSGNSMVDEGIFDGDTVIIRKQQTAENGENVVALINGSETTLKKIYKEKGGFRLQPANPDLKPIFVKELEIQGKVVSVIRTFEELKEKINLKSNINEEKNKISNDKIKQHLNKIFLGDIMDLLKKLPDKSIDMIFGDPDYNVGRKYGDKKYTKNFEEYINWYIQLAKEAMRVLKDDGNLFMMNYPKQNAHLRVEYLDKIYPLIHEYVWVYNSNVGHTPNRFTTAHRSILHIRKTKNNKFYKDSVAVPYQNPTDKRIISNLKNGSKGRMPYSWFYFNLVKNVSKEKTYHACQIPQKLTEMLIRACTKPNDIVLILFGGSGSELEVCRALKRQYISAEIDEKYHELIVDRLKNGYIKKKYKLDLRKNKKAEQTSAPAGIFPLFNFNTAG